MIRKASFAQEKKTYVRRFAFEVYRVEAFQQSPAVCAHDSAVLEGPSWSFAPGP
jgi:hypothetical protein